MYFLGRTLGVKKTYIYYKIRSKKKRFPQLSPTFNGLLVKGECEGFYSVKKPSEFYLKKILVSFSSFVGKYASNCAYAWEIISQLVISKV